MDVILKVLEGAKIGAKIAVKKDQFLIGRSSKCHLCAGSTAVSRKHCAISRAGTKVLIKDMGSRNGTLVNSKKIAGEVELSSGDEITVGPLRFLLTITPGIKNEKRPHVKSVAEAVDRTVAGHDSDIADDDISRWLIEPNKPSKATTETQTVSMDDTNAIHAAMASKSKAGESSDALVSKSVRTDKAADKAADKASDRAADKGEADKGASTSKPKGKKEPGKLPPVATGPLTKDSRDAAAAALRNWNRRS